MNLQSDHFGPCSLLAVSTWNPAIVSGFRPFRPLTATTEASRVISTDHRKSTFQPNNLKKVQRFKKKHLHEFKTRLSSVMNISKDAFGKTILVGTCTVTGREIIEPFTCPELQIRQILRATTETSVRGVVLIAESRWQDANSIRAERYAKAEFFRKLSLGYEPGIFRWVLTRQEARWLKEGK